MYASLKLFETLRKRPVYTKTKQVNNAIGKNVRDFLANLKLVLYQANSFMSPFSLEYIRLNSLNELLLNPSAQTLLLQGNEVYLKSLPLLPPSLVLDEPTVVIVVSRGVVLSVVGLLRLMAANQTKK